MANDGPSRAAAGVFTANRVKAAPVRWSAGVVAGGRVRWTFPGMPAGTSAPAYLNFTMTARAAAALPEGASLPNTIRVNDTSLNGLLMPEQISVLPLTLASPVIPAASASFGARFAVPNVPLPLYVNFTNGGNEPAATGARGPRVLGCLTPA